MRWIIILLGALSLVCLWGGLSLLSGDGSASISVAGHTVGAEALGLGVVYLGVVCERLAVALGFLDSRRAHRSRWSLVLVLLCLLVVLNSLFFALRVRGALSQRWAILGVPPEEVTPIVEALLLAPIALVYALFCGPAERLAARRRARSAHATSPIAEEHATSPSPSARGPLTPPLPLPAAP